MQRLYLPELVNTPDQLPLFVSLTKEQIRYLTKVLRLKENAELAVFDGKSKEYSAKLVKNGDKSFSVEIIELLREADEKKIELCLAQSHPKTGKIDLIVQKATEIGVDSIWLFESRYSVAKLTKNKEKKKIARLQKIAEEAARQSTRIKVPGIRNLSSFSDLLDSANEKGEVWLAYEGKNCDTLKDRFAGEKPKHLTILIGPEGGFSEEEIELANKKNVPLISLGKRILRTETAGIVLLSIIQYEWGDMNSPIKAK